MTGRAVVKGANAGDFGLWLKNILDKYQFIQYHIYGETTSGQP